MKRITLAMAVLAVLGFATLAMADDGQQPGTADNALACHGGPGWGWGPNPGWHGGGPPMVQPPFPGRPPMFFPPPPRPPVTYRPIYWPRYDPRYPRGGGGWR